MATQKIIHYKIMVSTVFPAGHPRKGQRTYFMPRIKEALGIKARCCPSEFNQQFISYFELPEEKKFPKVHTIRNNYPLWVERMKKVHAGKAVIDLCYWKLPGGRFTTGNEAIPFATLDKDSGCGVQPLEFLDENFDFPFIYCFENTKPRFFKGLQKPLAHHDGLSLEDFKAWFKGYDLSKSMAIIQFTKFRY